MTGVACHAIENKDKNDGGIDANNENPVWGVSTKHSSGYDVLKPRNWDTKPMSENQMPYALFPIPAQNGAEWIAGVMFVGLAVGAAALLLGRFAGQLQKADIWNWTFPLVGASFGVIAVGFYVGSKVFLDPSLKPVDDPHGLVFILLFGVGAILPGLSRTVRAGFDRASRRLLAGRGFRVPAGDRGDGRL